MRAIFFDEADARAVVVRLRADEFAASLQRERLAGEDDDEDHPWAVVSDAPGFMLEEEYQAVDILSRLACRSLHRLLGRWHVSRR